MKKKAMMFAFALMVLFTSSIHKMPNIKTASSAVAFAGEQIRPRIFVDPSNNTFFTDTASVGTTFKVNVKSADFGAPGVFAYQFTVSYDKNMLEAVAAGLPASHWLTPANPANIFVVCSGNINKDQGFVEFAASLLFPETAKTGGGTIATVTFKITKIPTQNGTLTSKIEIKNLILVDNQLSVIPPSSYDVVPATFTIRSQPPEETLINEVIVPENLTTDLIVFKYPKLLQHGDVITPSVPEPGHEHTVNSRKWFYWINDCPYALFAHSTRYVFVDGDTGECDVWSERWPPALNGKQLWATPEEYWNTTNWIYSTATNSSQFSATKETNGLASGIESSAPSIRNLGSQSAKRSLIIEGDDPTGCLKDASKLGYNLMINFGYSDQEITYLTPRNKTSSACTRENVFNAIKNLSDTLNSGDALTIFIFAHGYIKYENNLTGYVVLNNFSTLLYDYELKQNLSQIKEGVHINIIIESCYSGSLMDDLWSLKNVEIMITSTDWKSASYTANLDPPINFQFIANLTDDPNTWDDGGEFSSGLIEDLNELRQLIVNGSITMGELYVKAFNKAKDLDAGFINGEKLAMAYNDREMEPTPLMATIFFKGDINHDGTVDILDISKAAVAIYCTPGDPMWDPEADLDKNASIDIVDISGIAVKFYTVYFTDDAQA